MDLIAPSAQSHILANPAGVDAGITTGREIPSSEETITATQKVFDTTELCEQILLNLPVDSLFMAQFICHTTHSVIKSSKVLQEQLFFRAADNAKKPKWDFNRKRGAIRARGSQYRHMQSLSEKAFVVRPLMANTLILSGSSGGMGVQWTWNRIVAIHPPFNEHFRIYTDAPKPFRLNKSAMRSRGGSERYATMFLTQPPATKVMVDIQDTRGNIYATTIANPAGVRWREVLNVADKKKGRVTYIGFPNEVVVTPQLKEQFETWLARSHGGGSWFVSVTT